MSGLRGECLHVTDDVCPAELQESTGPVFVILDVSRKPVRDDNAVKEFSRHGAYDPRTTRGTDGKKGEGVRGKYQEPCKGLIVRMASFINIERLLIGQFIFEFIAGRTACGCASSFQNAIQGGSL